MKKMKSLLRGKRLRESWFSYLVAMGHLWLGLLSAVVVCVVSFSGAMYGLRGPVDEWLQYSLSHVEVPDKPRLSLDSIAALSPAPLQSIYLPQGANQALQVSYANDSTGIAGSAYINPYTGAPIHGQQVGVSSFFSTMLSLHRNLLLGTLGKHIVGASILVFVFMLLSGLVLWWPRSRKALGNGLRVEWRQSGRRLLRDLHNTLGFYTLLLLLFIAITGLYVSYPWVKNGIVLLLGGESVLQTAPAPATDQLSGSFADLLKEMLDKEAEKKQLHHSPALSVDSLVRLAEKGFGQQGDLFILFPSDENPRYSITLFDEQNLLGIRFPSVASFDKRGELKQLDRFSDRPLHKQFMAMSLPLHTGEFFGLPGILLYVLVSLVGCSLPITGFLLWWKRST